MNPLLPSTIVEAEALLDELDSRALRQLARYLWPAVASGEAGFATRLLLTMIDRQLERNARRMQRRTVA